MGWNAAVVAVLVISLHPGYLADPTQAHPVSSTPPARIKNLAELNDKKISLTLSDSTVRDALKGLFAQAPINRCIFLDNAARGLLNFTVKDVPFEGALVSILRSLRHAQYAYQGDTRILLIQPVTPVDRASLRVTLDMQDVDIRWLVQSIMRGIHANYTVDHNVAGVVSLSFDNLPFDQALERILTAGKLTFTIDPEGNTYQIRPKP